MMHRPTHDPRLWIAELRAVITLAIGCRPKLIIIGTTSRFVTTAVDLAVEPEIKLELC